MLSLNQLPCQRVVENLAWRKPLETAPAALCFEHIQLDQVSQGLVGLSSEYFQVQKISQPV